MLWPRVMGLRVMGLLAAAALACAAARTADAEPSLAAKPTTEPATKPATKPADGCKRAAAFRVIIDVGHTEKAPGAISARGVPEFVFNLNLAKRIEEKLLAAGFPRSVLLITEGPSRPGLAKRVQRAKELAADLFLSIHHDSVPTKFLETWEVEGTERRFSDRFAGHSIFISQDSADYAGSLLFAKLLGGQLQERGLKYTPHYTDPIMGNRQRRLVDVLTGVYRYDQLIVLRTTGMPAVLLEAGSIINREEELRMGSAEHQALTSAAVTDAVMAFCNTHQARAPAPVGHVASRTGKVSKKPAAAAAVKPTQPSANAGPLLH